MVNKGFSLPLAIFAITALTITASILFVAKFRPSVTNKAESQNINTSTDQSKVEDTLPSNFSCEPTQISYSESEWAKYRADLKKARELGRCPQPIPHPTPTPPQKGERLDYYTKPFSFNEFGIYSPKFEGKEITTNVFKYHEKEIKQKTIKVEDNLYAEVWEFEPSDNKTVNNPNHAVFFGFENYSHIATPLAELKNNWEEPFTNTNSVNFSHYYYKYGGIDTYLDSFQVSSPNGKPILIRIIGYSGWAKKQSFDDPDVAKAKQRATELASTISLTK